MKKEHFTVCTFEKIQKWKKADSKKEIWEIAEELMKPLIDICQKYPLRNCKNICYGSDTEGYELRRNDNYINEDGIEVFVRNEVFVKRNKGKEFGTEFVCPLTKVPELLLKDFKEIYEK